MTRVGRKRSKSGIYHIVLRGINRQIIFEEEEDSIKFLDTLKEYQEISGYKIYAYCLMENHIHLLLKEEQEDLGIIMRRIGASYVYWYNWKYRRCGHLFQDRFRSEVVEDEAYFLTALRYIHQNPVKAGIVNHAGDYKWSSYSEYIDKNVIIDIDFALNIFSRNREKGIESFKEFHQIENDDACIDIEENRRLTDEEAIGIIKKVCHISHCNEVQIIEKDKRDRYLKMLKGNGLSTRQIARLTGISRSVILKV